MSPQTTQLLTTCVAVFGPVLACALGAWLTHKFGPNSTEAKLAHIFADSIVQQGHGETQAAVIAKAGLAGLDEHPLVKQAAASTSAPPPLTDASRN